MGFQKKGPVSKPNEAALVRVLEAATLSSPAHSMDHAHSCVMLPHIVRAARCRVKSPAAAREVAERPSDRRACLVLPAVRKLALLAALCTRGARVFDCLSELRHVDCRRRPRALWS